MTAFAHRDELTQLTPEEMDHYWAHGWFRMRQTVFTTHFLEFDGNYHAALWLRVDLSRWKDEGALRRLERRNQGFRSEFRRAETKGTSLEHESLFQRYRGSLAFEVSPTLQSLLFGRKRSTLFETWEVNLYDNEVLIAAGIFDIGKSAGGGITCFFDPAYKKYTLGKYLIYNKMEFCRSLGIRWFYPGYFAPGHARFDYKRELGADAIEYLHLGSGQWKSLGQNEVADNPLALMEERLEPVRAAMEAKGWTAEIQHYLHLDINLNPQLGGVELFDFPVFVNLLPLAIVFDPRDGLYHVGFCRSAFHFDRVEPSSGVFASDLLAVDPWLFTAEDPTILVEVVNSWVGRLSPPNLEL